MWPFLAASVLLTFAIPYLYWKVRLRRHVRMPFGCFVVHDVMQRGGFTSASRISESQLEMFISEVRRAGMEFVPMSDWLAHSADRSANGADGKVLLTFDDGLESFYHFAYPILRSHRVPATVFLVTSLTGESAAWDYRVAGRKHLNQEQIDEISGEGLVEFGSHSANHVDLTRVSGDTLVREISTRVFTVFSYPFGRFDQRVIEAVSQAGYRAAFCGMNGNPAGLGGRFTIPRIPLNRFDNRLTLRAKLRGSMIWWVEVIKARIIGMFSPLTFDLRSLR